MGLVLSKSKKKSVRYIQSKDHELVEAMNISP